MSQEDPDDEIVRYLTPVLREAFVKLGVNLASAEFSRVSTIESEAKLIQIKKFAEFQTGIEFYCTLDLMHGSRAFREDMIFSIEEDGRYNNKFSAPWSFDKAKGETVDRAMEQGLPGVLYASLPKLTMIVISAIAQLKTKDLATALPTVDRTLADLTRDLLGGSLPDGAKTNGDT